jgi:hypothetical protein
MRKFAGLMLVVFIAVLAAQGVSYAGKKSGTPCKTNFCPKNTHAKAAPAKAVK